MALDDLVGSTTQNGPMGNMFFGNIGGNSLGGYLGDGNHSILQPAQPSVGQYPPSGIASIGNQLPQLPHLRRLLPGDPGLGHVMPLPDPHNPRYMFGDLKTRMEGFGEKLGGFGETLGGYSSQFDKFGEQLGGLGEQMGGYQDALGSFNEQMGGMGQQFETVNNKLDSVEKGIAGLDQQLQTQQQPQQVQQPQPRSFNPYSNPFGFGGFGGLGSLFGRRY
jgi:hypothetical protein